jgi:hypothetical protein
MQNSNHTTINKFIGYLVSIETKNQQTFYQGIINDINSDKALIQLKNCYQNGLHCGPNKLIDINTKNIENIEIIADPEHALNILKTDASLASSSTATKTTEAAAVSSSSAINRTSLGSTSSNTSDNNSAALSTSSSVTSSNGHDNATSSSTISSSTKNSLIRQSNKFTESSQTTATTVTKNKQKQQIKTKNSRYNQYGVHNSRKCDDSQQEHENDDEFDELLDDQVNNDFEENFNYRKTCFDLINNDEVLNNEFDFEKNLRLFNKDDFYERIEGYSRCQNNDANTNNKMTIMTNEQRQSQVDQSQFEQILKSIKLNNNNNKYDYLKGLTNNNR